MKQFIKIIKLLFHLLLEFVNFVIYLSTIILFCFFIGVHIINVLFQEIIQPNFVVTIDNPSLKIYLFIYFSIMLTILLLLYRFKKFTTVSIKSLGKNELFFYGLNAYLLAFFFTQSLILKKFVYYSFQIIFFVFFLLILPQIVKYYSTFSLTNLNKLLIKIKKETKKYLLFLFIFFSFVVLITFYVTKTIHNYLIYQQSLTRKVYIKKIIPSKTTVGEKVKIEGYNFGFRENELFQVKTTFGSITDIKDWNNNKIEFIIPLEFKEKPTKLWLERTKESSTQSALIKSNRISLIILPRWSYYPEEINYEYPPTFFSWIDSLLKDVKRFLLFKFGLSFPEKNGY